MSLLSARNSLINNRKRLESLSLNFLAKAKLALETDDEALAREVLRVRDEQLEASNDVLLHVDSEKERLQALNESLSRFSKAQTVQYVGLGASSLAGAIKLPPVFPKTPQLKFDAVGPR